jgi:hypothetical protein
VLTASGMGNRFFTMNGYHSLVEAHGIIAAITFLGIVPAAIILARFLGRSPFWALRMHIWLQITTLILTTVVFILGNFAVGPKRALTNPHHGIGVAIYVLVIVQVFGGALVHRREKGRSRLRMPLKVMLHHWFGRMIALLGIAQVALGLTLYGSPVYLFVLYTLWTFGLLLLYFILTWVHQRRMNEFDGDGSYLSGEQVVQEGGHEGPGWGKLAAYGAAGAGLVALFRRRSAKKRSQVDVAGTDDSGASYISNEKNSETGNRGWGRRLLEIGTIGGTIAAARSLFRRRDRDDSSDVGPYRPPLGGNQIVGSDSVSRIEEGRPPMRPITPPGNSPGYVRPTHPLANPPMTPGIPGRRNSTSDLSYYSYMSGSPSRRDRRGHTFRHALEAGGAMMAMRQLFKSRRQKKEERRVEEVRTRRLEEERLARENSQRRYTGDGITPPRRIRNDRIGSGSLGVSGNIIDDRNQRPGMGSALPVAGVGAAAADALANRDRIRPVGDDPVIQVPGGPPGVATNIPPIPPTHRTDMESSGSEVYTTASGRPRHRHHLRDEAAAAMAGAALGAAATDATRRRHSGRNTDSLESPPVSLKVKMHNDGRHVTLRRLTEEEAIAQREARRLENRGTGGRRRRNSSIGSSSGGEYLGGGATSADRRWRRNEALEAAQANTAAQTAPVLDPAAGPWAQYPPPLPHDPYIAPNQSVDPRTGQPFNLPPPPPIPGTASGVGGAPGSITSPGTETSGATEYANNRRRRRAERAQARQAREGHTDGGNTVDFT